MRMSRLAGLGTILVLGGLSGCGGSDSQTIIDPPPPPPPVPGAVAIVDGNQQSGYIRRPVPKALTVQVNNSSGAGMPNVKVDWSVTAGGGNLSTIDSYGPTISVVTDAQGQAAINWSLGYTVGTQTVSAAVTGVSSPATFSATAVLAPIVLHFDGTTWSAALKDNHATIFSMTSVWGSSSSDVFVGGGACLGPFVVHYNGTSWEDTPDCYGGSVSRTMGISGSSPSDVFALEVTATPPFISSAVRHYDGQSWTTSYTYNPGNFRSLDAIWSRSANDAFTVGDNGVILHFDGTSWNAQTTGTTGNLKAVWGVAGSAPVFAVGDAGTILYYDGNTWQPQSSGTTAALAAVSGTSANDVFAVGSGGTILHYDGTAWTAQTSGTTQALTGVWASGGAAFAVGYGNTILRYDGTAWTPQATTESMNFGGVWGTSPTNVYVVGTAW